jgi:DNA-binding MarR family transcriptional regulator
MHAAARQAYELIAEFLWGDDTYRRFHDACEAVGLSPPMLKLLLLLEPGDGLPMRAVAGLLRCDASWITALVDGLEERGLAERQASPTDRRVKIVAVTEDGLMAKKQAVELLSQPPASFSQLSAAEARQLRDLLRKALGAPRARA